MTICYKSSSGEVFDTVEELEAWENRAVLYMVLGSRLRFLFTSKQEANACRDYLNSKTTSTYVTVVSVPVYSDFTIVKPMDGELSNNIEKRAEDPMVPSLLSEYVTCVPEASNSSFFQNLLSRAKRLFL